MSDSEGMNISEGGRGKGWGRLVQGPVESEGSPDEAEGILTS